MAISGKLVRVRPIAEHQAEFPETGIPVGENTNPVSHAL